MGPDEPNSVTEFNSFFFGGGDPKEMIFAALRAQDFGSGRHGDKGQPSAVRETIYIAYVFLPENFFFYGNTQRCHLLSSRAEVC